MKDDFLLIHRLNFIETEKVNRFIRKKIFKLLALL